MDHICSKIKLDDAMEDEELKFGPNGGLIFCMEYLMENMDWLEKQLSGSIGEDGEVNANLSQNWFSSIPIRNQISATKLSYTNRLLTSRKFDFWFIIQKYDLV